MKLENNNTCIKVIGILNPQKEWIGNISIDLDTFEVSSSLKDGYSLEECKLNQKY